MEKVRRIKIWMMKPKEIINKEHFIAIELLNIVGIVQEKTPTNNPTT
jgi:hypothetical protein